MRRDKARCRSDRLRRRQADLPRFRGNARRCRSERLRRRQADSATRFRGLRDGGCRSDRPRRRRADHARIGGNARRCGSDRLRRSRADLVRFRGNARRCLGRVAGGKSVRLHVHRYLEAVGGVARIEPAGQRTLGHQPQRVGPPLRDRGLVAVRGRRHLLHCCLHGAQQHGAHLRRQPPAQHHHAVLVHLHVQGPARQEHLLGIRLRVAVHPPPGPHQPLHLCGGGAQGHGQQPRFGGGGGHPGQGAHFRVGQLAAGHGGGDVVEIGQRSGDAQLLAGGAEVEAGAPVEPVGAGAPTFPAVPAIELVQVAQQVVGGGVDARGQLGDLVAEQFQLGRQGRTRSPRCRVRRRAFCRRLLSGSDRAPGRLHDHCLFGRRHCRRLARNRNRFVFHDHLSYTRISDTPLTARGGAGRLFWAFRVNSCERAAGAPATPTVRRIVAGSGTRSNRTAQTVSTPNRRNRTKSRIISAAAPPLSST